MNTNIPVGSIFFFDIEIYSNLFYALFKQKDSNVSFEFERSLNKDFDPVQFHWFLWRFCIVGFNSKNYDIPLIELALSGANNTKLKEASDYIIKSEEKITSFLFEKKYNITISNYNHIDLIEVAPLRGSLKLYAGRLHCKLIQNLPFEESHIPTPSEMTIIRKYCHNDIANTELLYRELESEIALRVDMSTKYNVDLRSKSDAQLAEAIIAQELKTLTGFHPIRSKKLYSDLQFNCPDFIQFETQKLQNIKNIICNCRFELDNLGSPIMPAILDILKVKVGKSIYKLGIGGLHSMEKCISHKAEKGIIISDNDIESFYPRTILNQKLFPKHLGEAFLTVYEQIVTARLNAKKQGNKTISDSLKITINGSFGKFGNKWSILYSPQLLLQVTITGQLVLLMLIEALEQNDIEIISANTDGIIAKYHESHHENVRNLITLWEERTGYKTDETQYNALYSRDVNNYIAIKENGQYKTKGTYCERGSALNSILSRNPETLICIDAILNYLIKQIPIEQTITECKDIRRFVTVRNVKGGAQQNGQYLGKVIRWYYPKKEYSNILYASNGNKVPKTDGAKALMLLPDILPSDINYKYYIDNTNKMLNECDVFTKPRQMDLF